MATKSIGINIKQLPQINTVQAGDFIIIETPDGTGVVDYNDLIIDLDQTSFQGTIESLVSATIALSTQYTSLSGTIYDEVATAIGAPVAIFKNITPLTGGQTFSGPNIDLPFNFIEVNQLSQQQSIDQDSPLGTVSCQNSLTLSYPSSAFIFPAGTYKTFINATISSMDKLSGWMQLYLYQKTPPEQILLLGSSFTPLISNDQRTLTVDGMFTLCKDAEVSLRASTYGKFKIGSIASNTLISTATASPLSASLFKMLQANTCNISMYIEQIPAVAAPTVNPLPTSL
jgi:hypothetical protein